MFVIPRVVFLCLLPLNVACTGPQAFTSLHAIDTYQTIQIGASSTCYEADPITSTLIGEHPNAGEVLAWSVGVWALYTIVREHIPERYVRYYDLALIGAKAYSIIGNSRLDCE